MDILKATRIQKMTQEVVEQMGFDTQVTLRDPVCAGQGDFICNIRIEGDSNLLIGQHGVNLQALQHIIRLLAKKEFQENVVFSLDVNSYWEQKSQALVKEAHAAAEQALQTHAPVILRVMAGYERKIIHAELANHTGIVTESTGVNENRKVVVKPAPILE